MNSVTTASRLLLNSAATLGGLLCGRGLGTKKSPVPRIGFQCFSKHLALAYQTVIAGLQEGEAVETVLQILPHPHFTADDRDDLFRYAVDKLGLDEGSIRSFPRSVWEPFDMMFYTDVFASFPPRSGKNILLYHGIGTPRRFTGGGPFRKRAGDFDAVLCGTEADRDALVAAIPSPAATAVFVTGSPMIDRLRSSAADRGAYLSRLGLDGEKKTVLFAPHWTTLREPEVQESGVLGKIVAALSATGANVIVKLHFMSYRKAVNEGFDWRAEVDGLRGEGVGADFDHDDVPAMLASDLLVTDISSRGIVFAAVGRPVVRCRIGAPGRSGYHIPESVRTLQDNSPEAETPSELRDLVSLGLSQPAAAGRGAGALLSSGPPSSGSATEKILAFIDSESGRS